jgi:hypothetical protein
MDENEIYEKTCRRSRDPHRLRVDSHFFRTAVSDTDAAWMVTYACPNLFICTKLRRR